MPHSPSPFARPQPGLRIKEGAPWFRRLSKEEIASLPDEAKRVLKTIRQLQVELAKADTYDLRWMEGRHFLLAGATGSGLGGALATMVLDSVVSSGSVTVIARDLTRSIGYETGSAMQAQAEEVGMGRRFHWFNDGLALEGKVFDTIVSALREAGADRVVYINTVAAASSGLLPGYPPVFVKDVDENGLFQWQLSPLSEQAIEATRLIMGTMAIAFPASMPRARLRPRDGMPH